MHTCASSKPGLQALIQLELDPMKHGTLPGLEHEVWLQKGWEPLDDTLLWHRWSPTPEIWKTTKYRQATTAGIQHSFTQASSCNLLALQSFAQ